MTDLERTNSSAESQVVSSDDKRPEGAAKPKAPFQPESLGFVFPLVISGWIVGKWLDIAESPLGHFGWARPGALGALILLLPPLAAIALYVLLGCRRANEEKAIALSPKQLRAYYLRFLFLQCWAVIAVGVVAFVYRYGSWPTASVKKPSSQLAPPALTTDAPSMASGVARVGKTEREEVKDDKAIESGLSPDATRINPYRQHGALKWIPRQTTTEVDDAVDPWAYVNDYFKGKPRPLTPHDTPAKGSTPATALERLGGQRERCMLCSKHRTDQDQATFSDEAGFGFCSQCGPCADSFYLLNASTQRGLAVDQETAHRAKLYSDAVSNRHPLYVFAFVFWRNEPQWKAAWQHLSVLMGTSPVR